MYMIFNNKVLHPQYNTRYFSYDIDQLTTTDKTFDVIVPLVMTLPPKHTIPQSYFPQHSTPEGSNLIGYMNESPYYSRPMTTKPSLA
ncbi:hypothetical protein GWI33_001214 [Rhynchophorus ferrugineus]|uniref:Uncharacterized protein n=1 Tax=Rhynchophorus ferrugineus TaxID=354439 RepID=A0A834ILE0_RHYFE|nr:hypothetical protein GWI33_001214 [Rhynchophorus ferrugineus]